MGIPIHSIHPGNMWHCTYYFLNKIDLLFYYVVFLSE